jgi:hypothetical protein
MRERSIIVDPVPFLDILECSVKIQVNAHGQATVAGHIPEDQEVVCLDKLLGETAVTIKAANTSGEMRTIFRGLPQDVRLHSVNGVKTLEIDLVTESYQLDLLEHTRIFQAPQAKYEEILTFLGQTYEHYDVLMNVGQNAPIGEMLVQYKETDWEFIKRLTSRLDGVLAPDYVLGGVKYYFGLPDKSEAVAIDPISYTIQKDVGEFLKKTEKKIEGLQEKDATYYLVEDREIYELGQKVSMNGVRLRIFSIESRWDGGELIHLYTLKGEHGFAVGRYWNETIIGASLDADITDVAGDQVKLQVNCEADPYASALWLPYATVYSSNDGTGWYCMPEKGDSIRLYFPSEKEVEGYAISSVHLHPTDAEARVNPDNKSLRTKWGKEILFTPNSITMTNNKGMTVKILDEEGIDITSDKAITIHSDESLAISSLNADVQITAENNINMKQSGTQINLQKDVVLSGAQLNVQD